MRFGIPSLLAVVLCSSLAWTATYTVTNAHDSGAGSLRQAILDANASAGADVITFAGAMTGKTIKPTAVLPALTESTTIDGDLNDDNVPDVALDGSLQGGGSVLDVQANDCIIEGLAIVKSPAYGIDVNGVDNCRVRNCHLGVTLGGNTSAPNTFGDVRLNDADSCTIGEPGKRNIIGCATGTWSGPAGVLVAGGVSNIVQNNYFGLKRAGTQALGTDSAGVQIYSPSGRANTNTIRNNVFAGLYYGIYATQTDDNVIQGNLFGLAANGNTPLPIIGVCVRLSDDATGHQVGGTTAAARNVFVGTDGAQGMEIDGSLNHGNRVQGNYFGLNAAGTVPLSLGKGIMLDGYCGAQTIGGSTAAAGNYFVSSDAATTYGVYCYYGGAGTTIRRNTFGQLPGGAAAARVNGTQVRVTQTSGVVVRDNLIAQSPLGINIDSSGVPKLIGVYGNTFRACGYAAQLLGTAQGSFGNLGNASATDDGNNIFEGSNTWFIYNGTAGRVRAEGNSFGTTAKADIDAKIYDKLDDPTKGRVDFDPLQGGVTPTGVPEAAAVAVTGATALPTAHGAEVLFTLSAPAEVNIEVLNVAGRRVAALPTTLASSGLQRVPWGGRTTAGTGAPAGAYLVRITARGVGGGESGGLARLSLR
jgi:parallel beta-helix repeat protein